MTLKVNPLNLNIASIYRNSSSISKTLILLLLIVIFDSCTNTKIQVTDIDGNKYLVKNYQGVSWMIENLRTTRDKNGDSITYFNPNDNPLAKSEFGLLYDYETACRICPKGWKLPDNNDWTKLINNNGGEMKSHLFKDLSYWNEGEKDLKGNKFSVRPAGYGNNGEHPNKFKESGIIWSESKTEEFAWSIIFENDRNRIRKAEQHLVYAFSVRCIKE